MRLAFFLWIWRMILMFFSFLGWSYCFSSYWSYPWSSRCLITVSYTHSTRVELDVVLFVSLHNLIQSETDYWTSSHSFFYLEITTVIHPFLVQSNCWRHQKEVRSKCSVAHNSFCCSNRMIFTIEYSFIKVLVSMKNSTLFNFQYLSLYNTLRNESHPGIYALCFHACSAGHTTPSRILGVLLNYIGTRLLLTLIPSRRVHALREWWCRMEPNSDAQL